MNGIIKGFVLDLAEDARVRAEREGLLRGQAKICAQMLTLHAKRHRMLDELMASLPRLVYCATCKVVGRAAEALPEGAFEQAVEEAAQTLGILDGQRLTIRVAPHCRDGYAALVERVFGRLGIAKASIRIVEDAELTASDCKVESEYGWAEGTLQTRLDLLEAALERDQCEPLER